MATVAKNRKSSKVSPDVCLTFANVGWKGLQWAKEMRGDNRVLITYSEGALILMSPGASHEAYAESISDFIKTVARVLRIPTRSLRSTLFERRAADASKEADASFYVANAAKLGNRIPEPDKDPVPDLVVEVEITNPIDLSLRAYAALGVPEVWHFRRRPRHSASLRFLRREGDVWIESSTSLSFPLLESAAVLSLIEETVLLNDSDRADLTETWIREHLRPGKRRRD